MNMEKKDKNEFEFKNLFMVNMEDAITPNWDIDCDCNLLNDITGQTDFYEDR